MSANLALAPFLVRVKWVTENDPRVTMQSLDWARWEDPVRVPNGPSTVWVDVIDNHNGAFYFRNGRPVCDVPVMVGPQRLIYAWGGKAYSL